MPAEIATCWHRLHMPVGFYFVVAIGDRDQQVKTSHMLTTPTGKSYKVKTNRQ